MPYVEQRDSQKAGAQDDQMSGVVALGRVPADAGDEHGDEGAEAGGVGARGEGRAGER